MRKPKKGGKEVRKMNWNGKITKANFGQFKSYYAITFCAVYLLFSFVSCCNENNKSITQVRVQTQANGLTIEQENIKKRLEMDNEIGSIKHLYVISAYSGQVLIYSTIKGKVTSSGKRLNPLNVAFRTNFNRTIWKKTEEVLQDDGSYGSSIDYLYWWDTKGIYHQHYIVDGQILHISDQLLAVKNIVINMEIK